MPDAGVLAKLESPDVPPVDVEPLLSLYDASLEALERLDDPGLDALIHRLQRRRAWAQNVLAARVGTPSLNRPL